MPNHKGRGSRGGQKLRLFESAMRSPSHWSALFDALGDAILVLDPGPDIVRYANTRACELFRRTPDSIVGRIWSELCGVEDARDADREISTAAELGAIIDRQIRRGDGDSLWVEITSRFAVTGGGRFAVATIRDVSDRKVIEHELTATKDYLKTVFNNIHDAVFVHDVSGKVLDVNEKMLEMYQYSREEAIGLSIIPDYTTPEGRPNFPAIWKRVIAGEDGFFECKGRRPRDGHTFDVEVFLTRLSLPGNDYVLATVREISARKQAERELTATKDYLNTVFNSIHDAVFVHDLDGRVTDVNDAMLEMYKCTRKDAIGLFIHPDYTTSEGLPDLSSIWRRVANGQNDIIECRGRRPKDGFEFDVEVFLTRLRLPGGDSILATVRDISERKKVERELLATKNYLNTVFNSIHDAVFVHDLDGSVVDVNDKLLDMYRLTREEAIGLRIDPDYTTPESRPDLPAIWRDVMAGKDTVVECRGRRPCDGYEFDAETFLTRLSLPGGNYILANTHDVSARKSMEKQLQTERQRFKAVLESSPVGMVVIDGRRELKFNYLNPKFKELFGCDLKDTPDIYAWLSRAYPDPGAHREAVPKWTNVLELTSPGSDASFVRKVTGKGGLQKYVHFVPVRLHTGEILMTCWDITKTREAERRIRERNLVLEVLNEVMSSVTGSLDLSEIMQTLERVLAKKVQTSAGAIFLESGFGERTNGTAYWGVPRSRRSEFAAFAKRCYSEGEVIYDNEIRLVRHRAHATGVSKPPGFRNSKWASYLGISLPTKADIPGMIFLAEKRPDAFGDDHVAFYATLGQQIGVAIQNARLFEEVRQSHEEMKSLSLRLVKVQEEELRHVGRELHDEIGQLLTGLGLTLEMALRSGGASMTAELLKAKSLADTIAGLVRELSRRLRPSMLDDLGLLPTLPWLFERLSSHTKVHVVFEHMMTDGRRFGHEVETAIYRIVQEALTNIARHARTDQATVRLWATDAVLGVQIEDSGLGFDVQSVLNAGNINGLNGIRERAVLLGGQFTVDARPGIGTRVTVEFPLRRGDEER